MTVQFVLAESFIVARNCGESEFTGWYDGIDKEVAAELHIGITQLITVYAVKHPTFNEEVAIDVNNMAQTIYDVLRFIISVGEEALPEMTTDSSSFLSWLMTDMDATTTDK